MLNRLPRQMPPLSLILDNIGSPSAQDLARALGTSPTTAARWIREDRAPHAVMLALFWLTRWGHSAIDADAANAAAMYAGYAIALEREVDELRQLVDQLMAVGDFGSANSPSIGSRRTTVRPIRRPGQARRAETRQTPSPFLPTAAEL